MLQDCHFPGAVVGFWGQFSGFRGVPSDFPLFVNVIPSVVTMPRNFEQIKSPLCQVLCKNVGMVFALRRLICCRKCSV